MKFFIAALFLIMITGCHGFEKGHGIDKILNGGETGTPPPPEKKVWIVPAH